MGSSAVAAGGLIDNTRGKKSSCSGVRTIYIYIYDMHLHGVRVNLQKEQERERETRNMAGLMTARGTVLGRGCASSSELTRNSRIHTYIPKYIYIIYEDTHTH